MKMMQTTKRAAILALLAALTLTPALAAGFQQTESFSSGDLVVNNLIGKITINGGGSDFQVRVHVQGKDASKERIRLHTGSDSLSIGFPTDESTKFVYPEMGRGKTRFRANKNDGWLREVLGNLLDSRIEVSGSGSGLEVWADLEITVPSGSTLRVNHGVGEIVAENVDGELRLSSHSGDIEASRIRGDLECDTGSGAVNATEIDGRLSVDTGSGAVKASHIRGDGVNIDTGSGSVVLDDVDAPKVDVDTGSGSVKASGILADAADIDTGSGSVTLNLDRMGNGNFRIDTGSGRITLGLPWTPRRRSKPTPAAAISTSTSTRA